METKETVIAEQKIIKRDGSIVQFDSNKVQVAIGKANKSVDKKDQMSNKQIGEVVDSVIEKCKKLNRNITVEEIQEFVVKALNAANKEVGHAYAKYRDKRTEQRQKRAKALNYEKLINSYIKATDWRVKENSTVTFSLGGLILGNSGAVTANYWLSEIYDEEIANAHRNCDIHLHDLSMLSPYCAGWSLKQLIKEGLGGITGKITSAPASHLSTLCNQMVNFLGIMQNEWAGAQAFSSFDTYLAPFVKKDNLSYEEVKQCIQSFIYGVNTPSRWGTQAPFTNVTLDWTVPEDLAELPAIVGGKEMPFKYKDCKKEMDMVNKAFIEIMIEGDANGRGFQYPIPTYSITKDFDWSETENNKLLFEMAAKYGTPYFSNYVNSDQKPSDIRSMCITEDSMVWCRLNGKTKHITIKELYESTEYSKQILTRFGYRDIKELQRFEYEGDLLQFITSSGKSLTSTPEHEHVVYNNETKSRKWITNGKVKKIIDVDAEIPEGFSEIIAEPSGRVRDIVKKKAYELKVGDYFTLRHENPGEKRKGKSYEDIYGVDKANEIKTLYSEQRTGREPWNKGIPQTEETKEKISMSCNGHYVSQNCKDKSSERWSGEKNPVHQQEYWNRNHIGSCLTSPQEFKLMEELDSLGYECGKDYIHQYCIDNYISDFYIPEKNLVIECETHVLGCFYNVSDYKFCHDGIGSKELKEKYEYIKSKGYNLLVYNPKDETDTYRQYINKCERIEKINKISNFKGYVYDLEVDCDDIQDADTTMFHTFYANEILTGNCCRLRLDLRELRKKSGGFFGSGESTGSIGVVTINMPRLAYLSKSEKEFYEKLDKLMDIAARSLKIKRDTVSKLMEQGLYPYTYRYLGTFNNHFSTIGLVGMNECCLNAKWLKKDLTNKESVKFSENVLNHMREKLSDYQEQYGDLYNLEATPAESTTYRFAKHDKEAFPDIISANMNGDPYYTNSSHLPVGATNDIFEALDVQDKLQTLYTSGTVFHTFLGERLPDWKAAANLVRTIANNYKLPYFTLSPTYSVCKNHGYVAGEVAVCPHCGEQMEINSRITGYYRPVQNWNVGKKQEFIDRNTYSTEKALDKIEKSGQALFKNDNFDGECASCKVPTKAEIKEQQKEFENSLEANEDGTIVKIFTTPTCPNCAKAKELMTMNGIKFNIVDATIQENRPQVDKFGVQQAPTLIINDKDKIVGLSNIIKYIEERSK